MILLFGYNYIDSSRYEPTLVRVKCKLWFSNLDEATQYVNDIKNKYNVKNLENDWSLREKILALDPYHIQL